MGGGKVGIAAQSKLLIKIVINGGLRQSQERCIEGGMKMSRLPPLLSKDSCGGKGLVLMYKQTCGGQIRVAESQGEARFSTQHKCQIMPHKVFFWISFVSVSKYYLSPEVTEKDAALEFCELHFFHL